MDWITKILNAHCCEWAVMNGRLFVFDYVYNTITKKTTTEITDLTNCANTCNVQELKNYLGY